MTKILVIDDSVEILYAIVSSLEYEGFHVLSADNGLDGVKIARDELPDIIVCDINMPEFDGFDVLAQLSGDSITATIPFIFLSARKENFDVRTGMDLGADDYIAKPFDPDILISSIRTRLEKHRGRQLERMRKFAHRVVFAQDSERQNLSSTLQDSLANPLIELKDTLRLVEDLPDSAKLKTLQTVEHKLDHIIDAIHTLSHTLWPSDLSEMGLLPALSTMIEQFTEQTRIQVEMTHANIEAINDPNLNFTIYNIIQESLKNIEKHADVKTAYVKLWVEGKNLRLLIEDKGVGFNVEQALNDVNKIGLVSIQERAYLMKGNLTVLSTPNVGTQIHATLPS